MTAIRKTASRITLALFVLVTFGHVAMADKAARLESLLTRLADPQEQDWEPVAEEIMDIWGQPGSRSMSYLLERSITAAENDNIEAAIEHATAAIDHAPGFGQAYFARGNAFAQIGEFGLALADFTSAISLLPSHFEAYHGIGYTLEQMGEYDGALQAYRQSHALNPHMETVLDSIARLEARVEGSDI